jgi:transcriptional regulator with XRE-family HTH domain
MYTPSMVLLLTRLRALRERKGLTQAELAAAAGITRGSLGRPENLKGPPRPPTTRRLARALGVKPEDLSDPPDADAPA